MLILFVFLVWFEASVFPGQHTSKPLIDPTRTELSSVLLQRSSQTNPKSRSTLTGVYRIDISASDKLYSVVAGASASVPFSEQQRFFIDLAVRLTPPDLLAIEQQGTHISLGSSRASRMTFVADGVTRNTRAQDGHIIRVKFSIDNSGGKQRLVFTSNGRTEDNFTVVFESIANGQQLRVVRRIEAEALNQPLVIQTIYHKVSEVARWELYGEAVADISASTTASAAPKTNPSGSAEPETADVLRQALNDWIKATTDRNIDKQMSFYAPRLKAYYLTRNTPMAFVREDKKRVFAKASLIEISADEPEIIFQDGGQTAIMRYRKQYRVDNGRQSRRGQVIQELRWQRSGNGWRIFSERDIRVLR